jgi:molecular chaperone GrpE
LEKDEKDARHDETPSVVEKDGALAAELDDVESLKAALAEEKAKAQEHLASWQRTQADFINYKRRVEQERSDAAKFANAMVILNLLPVLDDMERALENVSTNLAGLTWVEGIRLIYRKLQSALQGHGLTEIEAVGQPFDPNLHEAVLYGEGEEGMVIEQLQKGYKLHERVLRPTMVKVGRSSEENEETEEASEGGE